MTDRVAPGNGLVFWAIVLANLLALASCRGQTDTRSSQNLFADVNRQAMVTPAAIAEATHATTVEPTTTAQPTATAPPTPLPTATLIPEVRLFVPEHIEHNVLAAFQSLVASNTSWRWQVVDSSLQADISLEPGNEGIPAGSRAIALAVPFDSPLQEVSYSEAQRIAAEGHESVFKSDWALIQPIHRALRVDGLLPSERNYPLRQNWSLTVNSGYQAAAEELAPYLHETIHQDQLIHLTAVGDLMMDRAIGYALENGDLTFPFASVSSALRQADLTVGNLESSLGDRGQPESKSYTFQAPPPAAEALALAGFDLVSLANNHALDYGPEALQQGMELLTARGIAAVGAGPDALSARRPFVFHKNGLTVAFLSYVDVPVEVTGFDTRRWTATDHSPGVAWADTAHIEEDVASALVEADLVVVLLHSGYEYVQTPSPNQMNAARTAIAAGADLVIGHHAHVLQGMEFNEDSTIVYGLGNFAFEIDGDPTTVILDVWLDSDGVRQVELTPAIIESGGRPRLATTWEAPEILQRIYYMTNVLSTIP